ncbi:MAG: hypothetical protein P1V51_24840 [Deltaproteobacteria bacterium]|nr:hypothetical protein [Deltaproteobacteria bacterium]
MHPLLKTLTVVILVGAAGAGGIWYYTTTTTQAAYTEAIQDLQQQWTERLGTIRGVDDPQRYKEEIHAGLKWYFSELNRVYNRYPELHDVDKAWKEIELNNEKGHIQTNQMEDYREFFEYAKGVFDTLERGEFVPKINAEAENLHLDIYSVKLADWEGAPRLKIDFILWGAPRRVETKKTAAGTVKKVKVPLSFSRMFFQFLDAEGKVHGEMAGNTGEPTIKITHPERWIEEFPAQAVLGSWWVELFPPEAEKVIWEIGLSGTSDAGNPYNALFKWEFPVPPQWKTAGDWGGTETVMPEEYINRTETTE